MVETKISFLNGLVSTFTFSLYTFMHITMTCASGSGMSASSNSEIIIPKYASEDAVVEAFSKVSEKSVEAQAPVFVRFE